MEWLRNIESSRSTRIARQYMSIHIVGRTIAWVVVPGALRELDEDHISVMALCLFGDDRSNSAGVTPQSGQFCRAGRGAGRPIAGPRGLVPGGSAANRDCQTASRARPGVNGARHVVETAPTCVGTTRRSVVSRCYNGAQKGSESLPPQHVPFRQTRRYSFHKNRLTMGS